MAKTMTNNDLSSYRNRMTLPLLLGLVAMMAAAGMVLAVGILTPGGSHRAASGGFAVSDDVPTSFGFVAVEHAEVIPGTTAKQMGGMTHGIQNFVPPDKVQVQASVTLTNSLNRVVSYSPRQFRLIGGKNKQPIAVSGSTIQPGTLQPDAAIDATLSFVAPRDGSELWIEFRDPRSARPVLIALGRTDKTPRNAFDGSHGDGNGHK